MPPGIKSTAGYTICDFTWLYFSIHERCYSDTRKFVIPESTYGITVIYKLIVMSKITLDAVELPYLARCQGLIFISAGTQKQDLWTRLRNMLRVYRPLYAYRSNAMFMALPTHVVLCQKTVHVPSAWFITVRKVCHVCEVIAWLLNIGLGRVNM